MYPTTGRQAMADLDEALPAGHGQTISQPSLMAMMTEALHLTPESRVLEIGSGSGYQNALLAELAAEVCSIERVPELRYGIVVCFVNLGA